MTAVKRVAARIVVTLLLAAAMVVLVGWQQGYRAYAVQTGSMAPTFPTGALVIDRPVDTAPPHVGDVITFQTSQGLVTHRVHAIEPRGVQTKGDANDTPDSGLVRNAHVIGVVTWGMVRLGYVVVFFQQPTGALSLMVLALSVWLAWSIFFPAKEEPVVYDAAEQENAESARRRMTIRSSSHCRVARTSAPNY
jgi:signal peptidase I